jgi:hypothetical protein
MATRIRTLNFLPDIFKTPTNTQFLSATLDQIVDQPNLKKIEGYIGSKFGYGVDASQNYVVEPTKTRTDYQLEPGVAFLKKNGSIAQDFISYPGILDALRVQGGSTDNNNRLFNSEFYSWDSFTDLDKLINFNQYYWAPSGLPQVIVAVSNVFDTNAYVVIDNYNGYALSAEGSPISATNPTITLLRGGVYTFSVNQASQFWIQGEAGVTGFSKTQPNMQTREVLGVENNGENAGIVTFTVPSKNAQDQYNFPGNNLVDVVSTVPFDQINGAYIPTLGGIDGVASLEGLTVMFFNTGVQNELGFISNFYDTTNYDANNGLVSPSTITITATNVGTSRLTCASTAGMVTGQTITFVSPTFGGINGYLESTAYPGSVGGLITGERYFISTVGDTDFTTIGASSNDIGTIFTATGTDPGTGTATRYYPVVYYVKDVVSTTEFTISETLNGPAASVTTDTGSMTANINEGLYEEGYYTEVSATFYTINYLGEPGHQTIRLTPNSSIPNNQKITATYGTEWVNRNFYRDPLGQINLIPYLSAALDTLYYQDGTFANKIGKIKLIDGNLNNTLDILDDIIGKKQYTSPNGIKFTNGLKVTFTGAINPPEYENVQYYVEGVGTYIELVPVNDLIAAEIADNGEFIPFDSVPFDTTNYDSSLYVPVTADYITIARNSMDRNAWSRSNRWFHVDVIKATATYNQDPTILNTYTYQSKAKRPIIEFNPNLRLFNSGVYSKQPVDFIDFHTTDAFTFVEGKQTYIPDASVNTAYTVTLPAVTNPTINSIVETVATGSVIRASLSMDGIHINDPIVFTGTAFGGLVVGQTYYVHSFNPAEDAFRFTVSESKDGHVFNVTTDTGTMVATVIPLSMTVTVPLTDITGTFVEGHYVVDSEKLLPLNTVIESITGTSVLTLTLVWTKDNYVSIPLTTNVSLFATIGNSDNYTLFNGARVIFAADANPHVRNKIYTSQISTVTFGSPATITLSESYGADVVADEMTYVYRGSKYINQDFFFDGVDWLHAQQKSRVNQPPLFDVLDNNGTSFGNQTFYTSSSFAGSTLFGYGIGSGTIDTVLNFPIRYSSVDNVGDISFDVSINSDTFNFVQGQVPVTQKVNTGYVHNYQLTLDYTRRLGWQTAVAPSVQAQIFEFDYLVGGSSSFVCDVAAVAQSSTAWPIVKVFVNNVLLTSAYYTVTVDATTTSITILSALNVDTTVQIRVLSDQVSAVAHYETPTNLNNNPLNDELVTANVGDIRRHYQSIYDNAPGMAGPVLGANNFRDSGNLTPYGDAIIQNSASLVLPGTFLRKQNHNLFDALRYNSREYINFRTLLMHTVSDTAYATYPNAPDMLDAAMDRITQPKTDTDPFFWSDMLPAKAAFISNRYEFANILDTSNYPLSRIYDFSTANYYGITVYLTRDFEDALTITQLIRGVDYTVSDIAPSLTITKQLIPGDRVEIREFTQTYGSYVPNTPTKLGLYPATIPEVRLDTGYLIPTYFIVGHDGSFTRLYGEYDPYTGKLEDFRDQVLLEFELRVYNNLKISAAIPINDYEVMPGYFRNTGYSVEEMNRIYSTGFLNWVGENRIDYKTQRYNSTDEFTYNYYQSQNKLDGTVIQQGFWRGLYEYLYDTSNPDIAPWEMLGFANKPAWFDEHYGVAPYTSENNVLWDDIAAGINWNNGNPIVVPQAIRSTLYDVMPVDTAGVLRSPFVALVGNYINRTFINDWKVGDMGPAELSYRRSSSWPFDLMRILALTKPAKFFNLAVDLDHYKYNDEFKQYLVNDRSHLVAKDVEIYGNGTAKTSYINWIVDYEKQVGIPATQDIIDLLDNLDVRLIYRLAGFSDKNLLKFYVEKNTANSQNNTLLIPDESYAVLLYDNQPFSKIIYSSVIIQITDTGYSIYGSSQSTAYFSTLKPIIDGKYTVVRIEDASAQIAKNYSAEVEIVPYGTQFLTIQDLSQFLASYGRYLESLGCVFNQIINGLPVTWPQMVAEFLYWAQTGWEVGSILNVNPAAETLIIDKDSNIVQPLTIRQHNFVLNQNQYPIASTDLYVVRDGTLFSASTLNPGDTINYGEFNISNFEHGVVFDNTTVFGDRIYNLVTGLRQNRIVLRGSKTAAWDGTIDAQGFIMNQDNIQEWNNTQKYTTGSIVTYKNKYWIATKIVQASETFDETLWKSTDYNEIQKGLLPNPSTRSYESSIYYDSNRTNLDPDADLLSFSLIGYRPRDYLAVADLTQITQINIFKNLIKSKGTPIAANTFKGATLAQGGIDYNIYENWSIKTAEFGGVLNSNFVEFRLNEKLLTSNPSIVGLTNGVYTSGVQQEVPLYSLYNYLRPITDPKVLYAIPKDEYANKLPDSGYVNFDDVKVSSYYYSGLPSGSVPLSKLYTNDYVWLADYMGTWQIMTPTTFAQLTQVANNNNDTVTFTFATPHGLSKNDPIAIVSFNPGIDGYYSVENVVSSKSIQVGLKLPNSVKVLTGQGVGFIFASTRVAQPSDILSLPLLNTEFRKNTVWVDTNTDSDWAVYRKSINYLLNTPISSAETLDPAKGAPITFGSAVAHTSKLGYLIGDSGRGEVYRYQYNALFKQYHLMQTITEQTSFGSVIEYSGDVFVITTPEGDWRSVKIYDLVTTIDDDWVYLRQTIDEPARGEGPSSWGEAVAISGDKNWLYISSTGYTTVHAYRLSPLTNLYEFAHAIDGSLLAIANDTDGFGLSLATNYYGDVVVVGTPNKTDQWGHTYVFDRAVQRFEVQFNSLPGVPQLFQLAWTPLVMRADSTTGTPDNYIYLDPAFNTSLLAVNMPVIFTGNVLPLSGLVANQIYYIDSLPDYPAISLRFTVKDALAGTIVTLFADTGDMNVNVYPLGWVFDTSTIYVTDTVVGTNLILSSSDILVPDMPIIFKQVFTGSGLSINTVYYVLAVDVGVSFTVSTERAGAEVTLTTATGSMTATAQLTPITITNTTAVTNVLTCADTSTLAPNIPIIFTSVLAGCGLIDGAVYYVGTIVDGFTFTVSALAGPGPDEVLVTATGTMTATVQLPLVATNTTITTNLITCNDTSALILNMPIIFTNVLPGCGLIPNDTYYVSNILDAFNFSVSATAGPGPDVALATASGAITATVQIAPLMVSVNGIPVPDSAYVVIDTTFNMIDAVNAGDIIEVSSTNFSLAQTLTTEEPIRKAVKFGTSVDTNTHSTEILVGAPFALSATNQEGAVYRYTNAGSKYGTITGVAPVSILKDANIMLNGYMVALHQGGATYVAEAINSAKITNIQASATNDILTISLIKPELAGVNDKLVLTVLNPTTLEELGIKAYTRTQVINDLHVQNGTQLGTVVKFNQFDSFVVSAPTAIRYVATTFDFTDDSNNDNDLIFDNGTTVWVDAFKNAGAVYMFDYLANSNESLSNLGKFVYAQSVNDISMDYGAQPMFGTALDFNDNNVIIGSQNFRPGNDNGQVVTYINASGVRDWSEFRQSAPIIDVTRMQDLQLYSASTNTTLDNLDFIDPLSGKLFGTVIENIDIISDTDPAGYSETAFNRGAIVWGAEKVGTIWFDTTTTRFVNYHQNDVEYNSKYWGTVFPGSDVTVYTWVESSVMPLRYTGPGTPYSTLTFTTKFTMNASEQLTPVYYFWVRNTRTVYVSAGKTLADSIIESYIAAPQQSGISYMAALKEDAFALYNCDENINDRDTVLHIGYSSGTSDDPSHSLHNLIRDGYADDFIPGLPNDSVSDLPSSLYNKMLDSLCGVDTSGAVVPNPYLPRTVQYGIQTRPNQSFFINRYEALKNYLTYANETLAQYPISENKQPSMLFLVGEINPSTANNPSWLGAPQTFYDTTQYWEYVAWWAPGYSNTTKSLMQVPLYADLASIRASEGLIVTVEMNGAGQAETYIYSNSTWNRIGLQNGTIQFKSSLWNYSSTRTGFGDSFYDTTPYSEFPSEETRNIVRSLTEEIFTNELLIHRNKSLILLFEFIQSETTEAQNYLPWLDKTSFIDVSHTIRELLPLTVYRSDNQEFLAGYLNEVKPYHVVIKEFLFKYTGTEIFEGDITDFDLPAQYNTTYDEFITPQLVYRTANNEHEFEGDDPIWATGQYNQWSANHGLSLVGIEGYEITLLRSYMELNSASCYVTNIHGFPVAGEIKIDDEEMTYASVDRELGILQGLTRGVNGTIISTHLPKAQIYVNMLPVVVLFSGRGYANPPKVEAWIDTTIYPAPSRPAVLSVVMQFDSIMRIDVLDSGAGYVVTPEIRIDPSDTVTFSSSEVQPVDNTIRIYTTAQVQSGDIVEYYVSSNSTQVAGLKDHQRYFVGVLDISPTLIIALYTSYHDAVTDRNRVNLTDAGTGNHYIQMGAVASCITTSTPVREMMPMLRFDRLAYKTVVKDWTPGSFYSAFYSGLYNNLVGIASSHVQLQSTRPPIETILASATGAPFALLNVTPVDNIVWSSSSRLLVGTIEPSLVIPLQDSLVTIKPLPVGAVDYGAVHPTLGFYIDMPIKFVGPTVGGIVEYTIYYVTEIVNGTQFKMSETIGGTPIVLTTELVTIEVVCYIGVRSLGTVLTIDYPGIAEVTAADGQLNTLTIPITGSGQNGTRRYYVGLPVVFNGKVTHAGDFIIGHSYKILTTGSTAFTSFGSSSNSPGTIFVATNIGSGTGTVSSLYGGLIENNKYYVTTVVDSQTITISFNPEPIMVDVFSIRPKVIAVIVATHGTTNVIDTSIDLILSGIAVGQPVVFDTTIGGIVVGTLYYVKEINPIADPALTKFTMSEVPGGPEFVLFNDTASGAITAGFNNVIICDSTQSLKVNDPVIFNMMKVDDFSADYFGVDHTTSLTAANDIAAGIGIKSGKLYYVSEKHAGSTSFSIAFIPNGGNIPLRTEYNPIVGQTKCLCTSQVDVVKLVTGEGSMTITAGLPISPGQIDGQQFTLYESSETMVGKTGTNGLLLTRTIESALGTEVIVTILSVTTLTNIITIAFATSLTANAELIVTGAAIGDLVAGTYYVKTIMSSTEFTVSTTLVDDIAGPVFEISASASGSMNITNGNQLGIKATSGTILDMYVNMPIKLAANYGGAAELTALTTYFIRELGTVYTTVTATTSSGNLMTCDSTAGFYVNMRIIFSGVVIGDLINGLDYYVASVDSSTTFTITTFPGDPVIVLTTLSGSMFATGTDFIRVAATQGGPVIALTADVTEVIMSQAPTITPVFNVSYMLGGYRVTISDPGEGYANSNTILIPGASLGPGSLTPEHNLLVTVTAIGRLGEVTGVTGSGAPNEFVEKYYFHVISDTQVELYTDAKMTMPVNGYHIANTFPGITSSTCIGTTAYTDMLNPNEIAVVDSTLFLPNDEVVFTGFTNGTFGNLIAGDFYYVLTSVEVETIAGAFIIGHAYLIKTIGTTDFTLIGAAENTIGMYFVATGVGSGDGTAGYGALTVATTPTGAAESLSSLVSTCVITRPGTYIVLPEPFYFDQSIVAFNDKLYECMISNSDEEFIFGKWSLLRSDSRKLNELDRIAGYYRPTVNMPGREMTQLVDGISYPNSIYLGNAFAPEEQWPFDTILHDNLFSPIGVNLTSVVWNGSGYVAPADTTEYSAIVNSALGDTWAIKPLASSPMGTSDILYANSKYVVTTHNPVLPIMVSDDSITWVSNVSSVATDLNSVTYFNGRYIAVGKNIVTATTDVLLWTEIYSFYQNALVQYLNGVASINAAGFVGFVAVGKGQRYVTVDDFTSAEDICLLLISPDGLTWTNPTLVPLTAEGLNAVAASALTIVIIGDNGALFRSTNGSTWSLPTVYANTNKINDIIYEGGQFVAIGNTGTIVTSSDEGINWDVRLSGTIENLRGISYNGSSYMIVGDSNITLRSSDGITWTSSTILTQDPPVHTIQGDAFTAGYGPDELVPGVVSDNLSMIIKTRPGSNWAVQEYQHTGYQVITIEVTPT